MYPYKVAKFHKETNTWTLESLPGAVNPSVIESFEGNDLEIQTMQRKLRMKENRLARKVSKTRVLTPTSKSSIGRHLDDKAGKSDEVTVIGKESSKPAPRKSYPLQKVKEVSNVENESKKTQEQPEVKHISTTVYPCQDASVPKAKHENANMVLSFWTYLCSCGGQTRIVPLQSVPNQKRRTKKKKDSIKTGNKYSQVRPIVVAPVTTDSRSRRSQVHLLNANLRAKRNRALSTEFNKQKANRLISKTTNDMDLVDIDEAVSSDSLKAEPGSALQLDKKDGQDEIRKAEWARNTKHDRRIIAKNNVVDNSKATLVDKMKQNEVQKAKLGQVDNATIDPRDNSKRMYQNNIKDSQAVKEPIWKTENKRNPSKTNPPSLQKPAHLSDTPERDEYKTSDIPVLPERSKRQITTTDTKIFRIRTSKKLINPLPKTETKNYVSEIPKRNSSQIRVNETTSRSRVDNFAGGKGNGKPQIIRVGTDVQEEPVQSKGFLFTVKAYFNTIFGCSKTNDAQNEQESLPAYEPPQVPQEKQSECRISLPSSPCSSSLSSISVKAVISIESLRSSVNSSTQALIESEDDDDIERMYTDKMMSKDANDEYKKKHLQAELPPLPPINNASKSNETAFLPSIAPVPPIRYKANPLLPPRRLDSLPSRSSFQRRQTEEKGKLGNIGEDDSLIRTSDSSVQQQLESGNKDSFHLNSVSSIITPFHESSSTPRASKLHAFIETYEEENETDRDTPDTPCSIVASRGSPVNFNEKDSIPGKGTEKDRGLDADSDTYGFFFS